MNLFKLVLFFLFSTSTGWSQDILGEWETKDDISGAKKGTVLIYKTGDKYYGKVTGIFLNPKESVCEKCTGKNKNKPIMGMNILENLKKEGSRLVDGTIFDPEDGKVYSCYLELMDEKTLKLRGYLGFSVLGRTQYWTRK